MSSRNATDVTIPRPSFASVPLQEGLRWRGGGGFLYDEKMDGRFCVRSVGESVLVGELMKDGRFFAFDCVIVDGQDIRQAPLRERLQCLHRFSFPQPARGSGGEFLAAVLARGGEGIVAKHLESPYGAPWFKAKRVETFDCVVTEKDFARGTIRLSLAGVDCGWCPCRAAFDSIQVGDVVEIAAMGLHRSGKLREAKFVRGRPDKTALKL